MIGEDFFSATSEYAQEFRGCGDGGSADAAGRGELNISHGKSGSHHEEEERNGSTDRSTTALTKALHNIESFVRASSEDAANSQYVCPLGRGYKVQWEEEDAAAQKAFEVEAGGERTAVSAAVYASGSAHNGGR